MRNILNRNSKKNTDVQNISKEIELEQLLEHKNQDAVKTLCLKFKNYKKDKNFSNVPIKNKNKEDLYNTFIELIKKSDKLPSSHIIENTYDIDKRERLILYNKLCDEGYLIKKKTRFLINKNKE